MLKLARASLTETFYRISWVGRESSSTKLWIRCSLGTLCLIPKKDGALPASACWKLLISVLLNTET
jgi:hypothetical protein